MVDTVVERLCDLHGGRATVRSEGYLVSGQCRPMDKDIHEETALPNLAGPGVPQTVPFRCCAPTTASSSCARR